MKHHLSLLISLFGIFIGSAQTINVTEKFNLPASVEETSGLIFFGDRLFTHNDSGNTPQLFELDTISSTINRTVTLSNAVNIDWEDMAQDDTYLYIGDNGNNSGSRTDLKIYRVLKSDVLNSTSVTASVINYAYADQVDFTPNSNNTNWDAEGLLVWGDYLFIFSKNWVNEEVDLYVISKFPGTHSAIKVGNFNAQGLITAVDASANNERLYVLGYSSSSLTPFLIMFYNITINPPSTFDIFSNSLNFRFENFLGLGNQAEGISFIEQNLTTDRVFITNEKFIFGPSTFDAKLRALDINNETLTVPSLEVTELNATPNPFLNYISFSGIVETIEIYDTLGRKVMSVRNTARVNTEMLQNGIYLVHAVSSQRTSVFKMIK